MTKETLKQQYQVVKRRTGSEEQEGSHVCHFGTEELLKDHLVSYIGTNPENANFTFSGFASSPISNSNLINSRDIPLLYLQRKVRFFFSFSGFRSFKRKMFWFFNVSSSLRFKKLQWSHLKDKKL